VTPVTRTTLYERLRKRSYRRWRRAIDPRHPSIDEWWELDHAAYLAGVRDTLKELRLGWSRTVTVTKDGEWE